MYSATLITVLVEEINQCTSSVFWMSLFLTVLVQMRHGIERWLNRQNIEMWHVPLHSPYTFPTIAVLLTTVTEAATDDANQKLQDDTYLKCYSSYTYPAMKRNCITSQRKGNFQNNSPQRNKFFRNQYLQIIWQDWLYVLMTNSVSCLWKDRTCSTRNLTETLATF